ncbi:hypothetical protein AYR61_03650 [Secundilactobacillus paracollinoides]|uniref:Major facilitator superfamily (MFS) profile domain-containing protein n=3 Tax=Secundilactobacillus paracollinoides TaxID=240427 RepID=A0A1B2IWC4_9LACO|nr:hypothetical protein AYR61_03650 [Secundilactobacillus paracollinoides]ANZ66355.1 hypothetical protein AYR63_03845 [Secundilactobacillus paracollinoides]
MSEMKLRWLAVAAMINNLGMSFVWPLTSVYLHNQLHQSLTVIGVVLLVNSLTGVAGSTLSGVLYDGHNPFKLLRGAAIILLGVMVGLTLWHGWPIFPVWLAIEGFLAGWIQAQINAIGTSIHSTASKRVFNTLYLFQNLGVVIGSSMVGFLYDINVALLFAVAAVLFVIFLIILQLTFQPVNRQTTSHLETAQNVAQPSAYPRANRIMVYIGFLTLFTIWVMYQQWVSNVSVYMTHLGFALSQYSILWTINATGIVLIQMGLNLLPSHWITERMQITFGMVMFILSFIVLSFAHQYAEFVSAMILLTIGESTMFPAIPALVNQLSDGSRKGKYQGMLNALISAGRAVGPLIGGIIIEATSYTWLFRSAVALYVLLLVILLVSFAFVMHRTVNYED